MCLFLDKTQYVILIAGLISTALAILALILQPSCLWVAIHKASKSAVPTELFPKGSVLRKVVTTALTFASAEDLLLPMGNRKIWENIISPGAFFQPSTSTQRCETQESCALSSPVLYARSLKKGLESVVGAEMYLQALRVFYSWTSAAGMLWVPHRESGLS